MLLRAAILTGGAILGAALASPAHAGERPNLLDELGNTLTGLVQVLTNNLPAPADNTTDVPPEQPQPVDDTEQSTSDGADQAAEAPQQDRPDTSEPDPASQTPLTAPAPGQPTTSAVDTSKRAERTQTTVNGQGPSRPVHKPTNRRARQPQHHTAQAALPDTPEIESGSTPAAVTSSANNATTDINQPPNPHALPHQPTTNPNPSNPSPTPTNVAAVGKHADTATPDG